MLFWDLPIYKVCQLQTPNEISFHLWPNRIFLCSNHIHFYHRNMNITVWKLLDFNILKIVYIHFMSRSVRLFKKMFIFSAYILTFLKIMWQKFHFKDKLLSRVKTHFLELVMTKSWFCWIWHLINLILLKIWSWNLVPLWFLIQIK